MIDPSFDNFANSEVLDIDFDTPEELLAVLVAFASILALSGQPYQDDSLREIFLPNDVVSLCFAVPLLFAASAYERLLAPGVLAYQMYSSLIYVLALREHNLGWIFFLHSIIFCLSTARFWKVTNGLGGASHKEKGPDTVMQEQQHSTDGSSIQNSKSSKWDGAILAGLGILFSFRACLRLELFSFLDNLTPIESAVDMADILIGIIWTLGGWELAKQKQCNQGRQYLALCLLLQSSALFFGCFLTLLIRPYLSADPSSCEWNLRDMLAVGAVTLSVAVPCGRSLRAAMKNEEEDQLEALVEEKAC
eukprot:scaffold1157_cov122-Cylindrotheca_fusiformis.AAC.5